MTFREATVDDGEAIRELVSTVLAEYGLKLDRGHTDLDLDDVVGSYGARGGTFRVLVSEAGAIVGCGGLYPLTPDKAEIRKMYLFPDVRGQGHGRALLEYLVDFARQAGFRTIVLETASVLTTAIGMYRRFGFVEVAHEHGAERCDKGFRLQL